MNKVIVACAGSGKTTYIVNKALENIDKKILITTFTDSNVDEIKNKIIKINGFIPSNIVILPWFTFQLDYLIKPYQLPFINEKIINIKMINGISKTRKTKDDKEYYLKNGEIFSDKIALLAFKTATYNDLTIKRLKLLFDYIYVDEFQDFSGYDLEIIDVLSKNNFLFEIVCDPRQHTFSTHYEQKNKQYICYSVKFIEEKCKEKFEITYDLLNGSYRCPHNVISFASEIFPNFPKSKSLKKCEKEDGIYFIPESQKDTFLKNNINCLQLRDSKKKKVNDNFSVSTFGKSKGLTVEHVLIYPTQNMLKAILKHDFNLLTDSSKSDLYVALTRAKHKTGILISDSDIEKYVEIKKYIDNL